MDKQIMKQYWNILKLYLELKSLLLSKKIRKLSRLSVLTLSTINKLFVHYAVDNVNTDEQHILPMYNNKSVDVFLFILNMAILL